MSRYNISTKDNTKYSCVIGWDNPLQTFFAHVYDKEAEAYNNSIDWENNQDAEEKQELILFKGYATKQIISLPLLEDVIKEYAAVPDNIKKSLLHDQSISKGPNEFQKGMIKLVEGLMKKQV